MKTVKKICLLLFLIIQWNSLFAENNCQCGMISKDPDYLNAIMAFNKAFHFTCFQLGPLFFPDPGFDTNDQDFEHSGTIHWKVFSTVSAFDLDEVPREIYREVKWTDTLEWPSGALKSKEACKQISLFKHQEEERFLFFKDYTVFPRAFTALRKDWQLEYQANVDFYKRSIAEFYTDKGLLDCTLKDLRYEQKKNVTRFKSRLKQIEEQEDLAFRMVAPSLRAVTVNLDIEKAVYICHFFMMDPLMKSFLI